MRFAVSAWLVAVLSPPVMACGLPQLAPNSQIIPKTFIYEKGWTIPGLAGASVIRTYKDEDGSDVTDYKPTKNVEVGLQGFEFSPDGQSIRLVPGYVQLVTDISEQRVEGRVYAYSVVTVSLGKADPPMWQHVRTVTPQTQERKGKLTVPGGVLGSGGVLGCGYTVLRYFDADGDGRFGSLEYVGFGGPYTNSTPCPTTPEWALKLLPNRAAAERCAKEIARVAAARELKSWAIPPVIRDILEYRPPAPVLAPRN